MLKKLYEQESHNLRPSLVSVIGKTLREVSYEDQIFIKFMDKETSPITPEVTRCHLSK